MNRPLSEQPSNTSRQGRAPAVGTPTKDLNLWRDAVLSPVGPPSATTKIVLLAVARRVNRAEGRTFAGAPDLGAISSCDERTVRRALNEAHLAGWVVVEDRKGMTPYVYPALPAGVTPDSVSGAMGGRSGRSARTTPDSAPGVDPITPDSVSANPGHTVREPRTESPTNSGKNSGSNSECDPFTYTDPNGWTWADLEPLGKRCTHGPLMPRVEPEEGTLFLGCRYYAQTGCKVTYDPRTPGRARAKAADSEQRGRLNVAAARLAQDVDALAGRHPRLGANAGRRMTADEIRAASGVA